MHKSIKGALFSALVFPGLGQLVLKRYLRGAFFLIPTMGGLVFLMSQAVRIASEIANNLIATQQLDNLEEITAAVNRAMAEMTTPLMTWVTILIVALWGLSIVDAYLLGRKLDHRETLSPEQPPAAP